MNKKIEQLFYYKSYDLECKVLQQKQYRWLMHAGTAVQTIIDLKQMQYPVSPVYQHLLTVLLFKKKWEQILVAGGGGGALAQFFSYHNIPGDMIEISPITSMIAKHYFYFPKTDNWELYTIDIQEYAIRTETKYDLIISDICVDSYVPEWAYSEKYLLSLKKRLSRTGWLVVNFLCYTKVELLSLLQIMDKLFCGEVAYLIVPEHNNVLVFASQQLLTNQIGQVKKEEIDKKNIWGIDLFKHIDKLIYKQKSTK